MPCIFVLNKIERNMNDFIKEGVKVGDRLYSLNYGWGEVTIVCESFSYFPIEVEFTDTRKRITKGGTLSITDYGQTIFWDEPKFEIPEKPKREVFKEMDVYVNYNPYTEDCEAFKDPSDATDRLSVGEINIKGKLTFTIIE